jgi:hypothetical protein
MRDLQQLNEDYERKLREVNEEAMKKIRDVQEERERILEDSKRIYRQRSMERHSQSDILNDSHNFQPKLKSPARLTSGSRGRSARKGGRNDRDISQNTIQMLDDSRDDHNVTRKNSGFNLNVLDVSGASGIEAQERDPKKLRDFYRAFCQAVSENRKPLKGTHRVEEVDLHGVLVSLGLIALEQDSYQSYRAVSSEVIWQQKHKFNMQVRVPHSYQG